MVFWRFKTAATCLSLNSLMMSQSTSPTNLPVKFSDQRLRMLLLIQRQRTPRMHQKLSKSSLSRKRQPMEPTRSTTSSREHPMLISLKDQQITWEHSSLISRSDCKLCTRDLITRIQTHQRRLSQTPRPRNLQPRVPQLCLTSRLLQG